jgi:hypothetical protein
MAYDRAPLGNRTNSWSRPSKNHINTPAPLPKWPLCKKQALFKKNRREFSKLL